MAGQARPTGRDHLAVVAGAMATATAIGYALLMREQGDTPVVWFSVGLVVAAVLAFVGSTPTLPRRATALTISGCILIPFGVLALFSVGLPIFVAGIVALVAADRAGAG